MLPTSREDPNLSTPLNPGAGLIRESSGQTPSLPDEAWNYYAYTRQLHADEQHTKLLAVLLFELSRELVQSDTKFRPSHYFFKEKRSAEFERLFGVIPNASAAVSQEFNHANDLTRELKQPVCPLPWLLLSAHRQESFLGFALNGYFRLTTSCGVTFPSHRAEEASRATLREMRQEVTLTVNRLVARLLPAISDAPSDQEQEGYRKLQEAALDNRSSDVPAYAVLEISPSAFTNLNRKEVMDYLERHVAHLWAPSKGGRNAVLSMLGDLAIFRLWTHYGAEKSMSLANKAWGASKPERENWLVKVASVEDCRRAIGRHLLAMRKLFPEHRYSAKIGESLPAPLRQRFCEPTAHHRDVATDKGESQGTTP